MASLQENRTVLTYLHSASFFRNETYIAGQMTKKSIYSDPVSAAAREQSVCGFGPIGEIMAADLHRAVARTDITGSVLEDLESLHSSRHQGYGYPCELRPYERCSGGALRRGRFMRIDCEVHAFRLTSRQAAPIIDGSMETLEGAARQSKIAGLVLVQPDFLNDDPAELFAQASQARMPVRLVPPLVQPLAPEVLEEWARSGAVGLALTLTDPDPHWPNPFRPPSGWACTWRCRVASKDVSTSQSCFSRTAIDWFSAASDLRIVPAIPPGIHVWHGSWRSPRWVKLSGIGRVADGWAQAAAGRMLQELGPEQLLWGSEWPHVAAAHAYAPSYTQAFEWLEELVPDQDARERILGETPAALYRLSVS